MSIFSTTNTGFGSDYDDLLDPLEKDFYKYEENIVGELVYMSPDEYIEEAYKILKTSNPSLTKDGLIKDRKGDLDTFRNLESLYRQNSPIWLPFLNYSRNTQEGIHRALWASKKGLESIPVLVVKPYDTEKHKNELSFSTLYDLYKPIERELNYMGHYEYSTLEELVEDVEFKVETLDYTVPTLVNVNDRRNDSIVLTFITKADGEFVKFNVITDFNEDDSVFTLLHTELVSNK